jgi:hypothetical protein
VFREAIPEAAPSLQEPLTRLADWADGLEREGLVKLASFRVRAGITTLLPRLPADNAGLVSIASDIRSAYMQFWRSVFERRAPDSIAGVEAALGAGIRQGNATRSFPEPLLETISEAYREAAGHLAARPPGRSAARLTAMRSIIQFRDDDRGYLAWTAAHPGGYVLNIERSLNPSDARLHRADCHTINGQPARGKTWTGPYVKICSASAPDMNDWIRTHLPSQVRRCGTCHS